MGILTKLTNGDRLKFEETDNDAWAYTDNTLQQYVDGVLTENQLPVLELTEEHIIIDWGGVTSTLTEGMFDWEE